MDILRNAMAVLIALGLLVAFFVFLLSVAFLFDVVVLQDIFSNFLSLLTRSPLAEASRTLQAVQQALPAWVMFLLSTGLLGVFLYLEYRLLGGMDSHLREYPLELQADTLFRQGKHRRALALYKKLGRWDRAAEIYRQRRRYAQAARMLERLGEESHATAADMYEQMGDMDKARRSYLAAAKYYRSRLEWERAATLFLKGGDRDGALACYESQYKDLQGLSTPDMLREKVRRLVQLAEQMGQPLKAAAYAEAGREMAAAAQHYADGGNYLKAAQLLAADGDPDKALQVLAKIDPAHRQYTESLVVMARIFLKKEKYTEALKRFLEYFKKVKPSDDNIEDFFQMGLCLERLSRLKQARDVFSRIHSMRPYFMNVDERIDAIDRKGEDVSAMHDLLEQEAIATEGNISDTFLVRVGERYTDLEELGRGGAGIVFRARDKLLDRAVALKQLPSSFTSDAVRLQAFFKEARAVAKLNHPNIVMIHDIMKAGSDYFIVMEFIDGVTLEKLLETKGALSLKFSLYIARHVLQALAYAHRCAVIHQDIKPANIMLTVDRTVKLTDFGIAHLRDELPDHSPEMVMGTPKYISPEQLKGVPVDERCDIYSFGVTFYEMLTGNLPFPTDGILHHHLATPPMPLRAYQPAFPAELEQIVMKCLEKNREDRYQSVNELNNAVKNFQKTMRIPGEDAG